VGRLIVLFLLLLPLTTRAAEPPPAATAAGPDTELAKAHFHTGQIYYDRGRYPDAAREFEDAYRLSGRAELLYNMGKSYDGVGDYARALAVYRRWLDQVKEGADRPAVSERVEKLAGLVGRIRIVSDVEGAQVELDGAKLGTTPLGAAVEMNPGGHEIVITHEGYRTFRERVVATPGGARNVQARLESLVKIVEVERKVPPTPVYKRWWLWTLVGAVVVAGAVTGGVLGSREPPVSGPFAQLPNVRQPTP
jgi:hypothetical protein